MNFPFTRNYIHKLCLLAASMACVAFPASAQNSYPTPGGARVPALVVMCSAAGFARPCLGVAIGPDSEFPTAGGATVGGRVQMCVTAGVAIPCAGGVGGGGGGGSGSISCGMHLGGAAVFCEPFDIANAGTPSRTGGLDPNVWGVSRMSQYINPGQGMYNVFPSVHIRTAQEPRQRPFLVGQSPIPTSCHRIMR